MAEEEKMEERIETQEAGDETALSRETSYPAGTLPPLSPTLSAALPASSPRAPKSPGLALFLSLFPGLGQIYNGQFAKALAFFFAWVFFIYATAEISPLPFALLIPFVYFFNLIDAYRSADLINARGRGRVAPPEDTTESPAWGATLLAIGLVLLLNNLGWLRLASFQRFWPILLIAAGGAFLYQSLRKKRNGTDDRL